MENSSFELALVTFFFLGILTMLIGLWRALKNRHWIWFICIFLLGIGSSGILPIVYLIMFQRENRIIKYAKGVIEQFLDLLYEYNFGYKSKPALWSKVLAILKNFILYTLLIFLNVIPLVDHILGVSKNVKRIQETRKFQIICFTLHVLTLISGLITGAIALAAGAAGLGFFTSLLNLAILIVLLALFIVIKIIIRLKSIL